MWLVSRKTTWIPMYLLIILWMWWKYGWQKALMAVLGSLIAFGIADYTCASVLRPLFCRLRPSNPDSEIAQLVHIVNGYRGGRYGFPSCHAANTFAFAVFISLYLRNRGLFIGLVIWALLNCYSRIYLGVHYPGDIICGMIIGSFIGFIVNRCLRSPIFFKKNGSE
ncbi:MAG: phosphatase PAP2 family protein [Muribaculaceae bacterium]|nr:phosphatase PAP2 family protein [Muribaculaceae bacterium]